MRDRSVSAATVRYYEELENALRHISRVADPPWRKRLEQSLSASVTSSIGLGGLMMNLVPLRGLRRMNGAPPTT